ncbi:hypothetical protein CYLTODRAFT_359896 [Cylindrobasidium torrendii FP15055 ss-10]|uniref:Metallo-dependent hydrolase n=1 Tax=Cylindrobasidium torrendii FP15055 ss-10 TaxID=1314674 RepID=A0A0D7B019_9AGAR|nr:hypothetical protein CYLTODRAFT_359896 [Cylindrobasidium torrendii FP15055 ss-10]
MGKKSKNSAPNESFLLLPHPSGSNDAPNPWYGPDVKIVDTHTHLLSTFQEYRRKYPQGAFSTIQEFVHSMYAGRNVESIIDVWCEAPVLPQWKELASMQFEGLKYNFVLGVHPHNASEYNASVESDIRTAMAHPACVGLGEIGLDFHYDNSPREIQKEVFRKQLALAVELKKPLTVHTREADEDTEAILKDIVPADWKIHIHCFTDLPAFGRRLLDHFPNLHIGVTGVITFATNTNTAELVSTMKDDPRIVLETDAPYMVPTNIYGSLEGIKGRLPLSHSAMIPWTAAFVANLWGDEWDAEKVIKLSRNNARRVYGV